MAQERLRQSVQPGLSILVGTVDADGIPTCCRGVALTTKDDFDTVTVYVPAATAQETVANVATTRRVAIVASAPLSHETVQIKGIARGVRLAPPADEPFVRERLDALAGVLEQVGFPRTVVQRLAHWPAFVIDVSVEEVFDQTPGPKAGHAIG